MLLERHFQEILSYRTPHKSWAWVIDHKVGNYRTLSLKHKDDQFAISLIKSLYF